MKVILEDFEDKVDEINRYFLLLKSIEDLKINRRDSDEWVDLADDVFGILKANTFLILYNLVESTIRASLAVAYEKIADDQCTYMELTENLRDHWIKKELQRIEPRTATPQAYERAAKAIVSSVMTESIVTLSFPRLAGNLNADEIRKLCESHGISTATRSEAKGGGELEIVRLMRNVLAHGENTFSEVGRNFTISQLDEKKEEIIHFLRSIIENIDDFICQRKYAMQR